MTKIAIEKSIPLPKPIPRAGKYPWDEMKIGDSFLFPKEISEGAARSSVTVVSKKKKMKFTVRKTEEGLRCWRIK